MAGPASRYSRNLFCVGVLDPGGNLFLSEPVPFRYVPRPDTVAYTTTAGDTWASLAHDFYGKAVPDAGAVLLNVIPDFQPVPVIDPTLAIPPGTVVYVPSLQTVETEVFSAARRLDFQA